VNAIVIELPHNTNVASRALDYNKRLALQAKLPDKGVLGQMLLLKTPETPKFPMKGCDE
jgi:hypothetical protein